MKQFMKKVASSLIFQLTSGFASIFGFYFKISKNLFINISIASIIIIAILLRYFYKTFRDKHNYSFNKSIKIFNQLTEMHKQNISLLIVKDKENRRKIFNKIFETIEDYPKKINKETADIIEGFIKKIKDIHSKDFIEIIELIKIYIENLLKEDEINEEIVVTINDNIKKIEKETIELIEDYLKKIKYIQFSYYSEMTELIKEYIENLLKEDGINKEIAVTIKQIYIENGDKKVTTIWRDRKTFRSGKRTLGEESTANLYENYDFGILYNKKHKKCFYENDLEHLKNYYNTNPQWQKFYNATVVVPIELPRQPQGIVGFLCIDCLNKNNDRIFTEIHCEILNIFGSLLSEEFIILEKLTKDVIDIYTKIKEKGTNTLGIIHEI